MKYINIIYSIKHTTSNDTSDTKRSSFSHIDYLLLKPTNTKRIEVLKL